MTKTVHITMLRGGGGDGCVCVNFNFRGDGRGVVGMIQHFYFWNILFFSVQTLTPKFCVSNT